MPRWNRLLAGLAAVAIASAAFAMPTAASPSASLTRYPYLTDLVSRHVTVNWATSTAITTGRVTYGRVGVETCHAHHVAATATPISVGAIAESQWKAELTGLAKDAKYCYRIKGDGVRLLGPGPAPTFRSQVPPRSSSPFSFAVIGDWGLVGPSGENSDQENVIAQIAASGARFAVTTGDTAYPDGSQLNYGDLQQTGWKHEHDLRSRLLGTGRRLDPAVQRPGQPRSQGRRADRTGRRTRRSPPRRAATRWKPTAVRTAPRLPPIRASGTRSTPAAPGSTCSTPRGTTPTSAPRTSTRTTRRALDVDSDEYQWLQDDLQAHPKNVVVRVLPFPAVHRPTRPRPPTRGSTGRATWKGCWPTTASTWCSTGTRTSTSATRRRRRACR